MDINSQKFTKSYIDTIIEKYEWKIKILENKEEILIYKYLINSIKYDYKDR